MTEIAKEHEQDRKIEDLNWRIFKLEDLLRRYLGLSQEEMDHLLGKP